jgi:hypothetical protein
MNEIKESILIIDEAHCLKIKFDCEKAKLTPWSFIEIVLHNNKDSTQYILYSDCIMGILEPFISLLKKLDNQQLELPNSFAIDIGLLWDKELHAESQPDFKGFGQQWAGLKFLLCETPGNADLVSSTWLFNKNGSMFLEITPGYKWHHFDPKPGEQYIAYADFMKQYKPIGNFGLSKNIVLQWLNQVEELLNIVKANYEKIKKQDN